MTEVAGEHGAANVTVAHVVERAGVSRRTFYEIFDDVEDCLGEAIGDALSRVALRVVPAYRLGVRWRDRMRAGLTALLRAFDEEPCAGWLLVVETLGAGRGVLERRSRVLAGLVSAVDEGCEEATGSGMATTRLTAEGVVGAVLSVIHGRMVEEDHDPLAELASPLMSMVVLPYLGAGAARRELVREVSEPPPARAEAASGNPLKDLRMRLTYRTLLTLGAVASHPGSSNRAIADVAGIGDQGQISKLLTRLERLGLIERAGGDPTRGEPNAWTLTGRGKQVQAALAARPSARA